MTQPPPQTADFRQLFERELRASNDARIGAVDRTALAWLAIPPLWSDRLARLVGYPVPGSSIDDFIADMAAVGLCAFETPDSADPPAAIAARVAGVLAGQVAAEDVGRIVEAIALLPPGSSRARSLIDVAPAVSQAQLARALELARSLGGRRERARVLAALASGLAEPERQELVKETLAEIADAEPHVRADVIASLAAVTSPANRTPLLRDGIEAARGVASEPDRARFLARLVMLAGPDLAESVAAVVGELQDSGAQASVLAAAKGVLPDAAIRIARTVHAHDQRGDAAGKTVELSRSASALAQLGDVESAVQAVERVESQPVRARLLAAVTDQIALSATPGTARDLATLADNSAARASDSKTQVAVQGRVAAALAESGAPELASRHVSAAREAANDLGRSIDDVEPLVVLAHALRSAGDTAAADAAAERALIVTTSIGEPRRQVTALSRVAPELPVESRRRAIEQALRTVRLATDPVERAGMLVALAPHVEPATMAREVHDTVARALSAAPATSFWMPEPVRQETLDSLAKRAPADYLRGLTAEIGQRLAKVGGSGEPIPEALVDWMNIAQRVGSSAELVDAGRWLIHEVEAALRRDDLDRAFALVDAGAAVGRVVGDPLQTDARLANRIITLHYRRAQDRRHLVSFLPRAEQLEAVEKLLSGREEWALHFLGMGGVGKTMLLRYITAELAPARGLATARVDFDYLSPDYPVRRPGQLLLEFMAELQSYATSATAEEYTRQLEDEVVRLHETLGGDDRPADPLEPIRGPEFDKLLALFGDILTSLGRRVLLILDTCEELAKVQPVGASIPSVDATFEIVERIHDRVPDLRVVFAGRRLLVRSGSGWSAADAEATEARTLLPEHKNYLALHEIRGFNAREASEFLSLKKQLVLDAATEEALLEASADAGTAAVINWRPPRLEIEEARFSPFDLSLHADWIREVGSATVAEIRASERDLYIERRIVGRIRERAMSPDAVRVADDVRSLLAAVVSLRRFDHDMLRPAFNGPDVRFEAAYRELSSQEWIDLQRDETLNTTFLEVDRSLYPRLAAYFQSTLQGQLRDAAGRLGPALHRAIEQRPVTEVFVEQVDAAVRMLSPSAASRMWDDLSSRLADGGHWDRAGAFTGWLLAENGAVYSPTHPLRAAVRALHVAALVHRSLFGDLGTHWAEVGSTIEQDPDPAVRRWLSERWRAFQLRAAEGINFVAAAQRLPSAVAQIAADGDRGPRRAAQVAASYVSSLEAVLEDDDRPVRERPDAAAIAQAVGATVAAILPLGESETLVFARTLEARALLAAGSRTEAVEAFERITLPSAGAGRSAVQRWLDWIAPARLDYRIRLEELRTVAPLPGAPVPRDRPLDREQLVRDLQLLDAERLASALLQRRLARGLVEADELRLYDAVPYRRQDGPLCAAHRETPPLFVTVALGWLALGLPDLASAGLIARRDAAYATGKDEATGRLADETALTVARRMRLTQSGAAVVRQYMNSRSPDDVALALPVVALTRGVDEHARDGLANTHPALWWRAQTTLRAERREVVRAIAAATFGDPPEPPYEAATADEMARLLDAAEAGMLFDDSPRLVGPISLSRWAERHPDQPEAAVRLALRATSLGLVAREPLPGAGEGRRSDEWDWLSLWGATIGERRVAELALEEGELLALRLPANATGILGLAGHLARTARDPGLELIAGVREGIALAHAGLETERARIAASLKPPYDSLRERLGDTVLPAWTELTGAVERRDVSVLERVEGDPWAPWTRRLFLVLAWSIAGRPTPVLKPGSIAAVPTEMLLDLGQVAGVMPPPRAVGAPPRVRSLITTVGLAALLFVGMSGAISALLGTPWWGGPLILLGLLFGLLAGPWLVGRLFLSAREWFSQLLAAQSHVSLAIGPTAAGRSSGATADVPSARLTLTRRTPVIERLDARVLASALWFVRLVWRFITGAVVREGVPSRVDAVVTVTGGEYAEAAAGFPIQLATELQALLGRVGSHRVGVVLRPDPSLALPPWEAMVALGAEPETRPEGRRLIPYRAVGDLGDRRRRGGRRLVAAVIADRAWATVAQGWEADGRGRVTYGHDVAAALQAETPAIVHVIGRAQETLTGIVSQVGAGASRAAAKSVESAVRGSGSTVRLSGLDLRTVALAVIQAEPVEPSVRRDSDRQAAARLRMLAEDAVAAGAETVFTVPALPPLLAERVVTILAQRLGPMSREQWLALRLRDLTTVSDMWTPTFSRPALIDTLAEVRSAIETWPAREPDGAADPAIYREIAFDATLYARVAAEVMAPDS